MSEQKDPARVVQFCPCCFATDESGSWGHTVAPLPDGGYCMNCGNGSCVLLPSWAVESIRQQASWVGKRYYPNKEDHEAAAEVKALRKAIGRWPGRTAERYQPEDAPEQWRIWQILPDGGRITIFVDAGASDTAEDAIRRTAARLPVVLEPAPLEERDKVDE